MTTTKTEPLLTVSGIVAAATAVIALAVAFGVPLTGDQQTAILGVVGVAAPVIVGIVARRSVTPNASVVERREDRVVVAGEANEMVPAGEVVRSITST